MNKKIESAIHRIKYYDLFNNEFFRDSIPTKTGKFFNSIEIIKNEATTFDVCYNHLLSFLNKIEVNHLLPDKLIWEYDRVGYDPFSYSVEYDLTLLQNKDFFIRGRVEEDYYFFREDVILNNFLFVSFTSSKKEDFDICLAHFDANVALLNKQYEKAYYKFSVPQNYSELFEIEINQELK